MVDPDQLASDKVSYHNLDPQSHCLPMIILVNENAPEVTTTNWCWLNSALEHTRKSTCIGQTPELCRIWRPNHELNQQLRGRAINCNVTDGLTMRLVPSQIK